MTELKLTIHIPELETLAKAIGALAGTPVKEPSSTPIIPAETPTLAPAMPPVTVSVAAPVSAPVAPPAAPIAPTAPVAPVSAPSYTIDQIAKAGAELIGQNKEKIPQLTGLLAQYGVPSIQALRPEQLGPFATALRGLGAAI